MKFFFPKKVFFFFQKKLQEMPKITGTKLPAPFETLQKSFGNTIQKPSFQKKSWEIKQTKISEQTLI